MDRQWLHQSSQDNMTAAPPQATGELDLCYTINVWFGLKEGMLILERLLTVESNSALGRYWPKIQNQRVCI